MARQALSPSIMFEQSYYDTETETLHLAFMTTNGDTMSPVAINVVTVDLPVSSAEPF